jgi:transposase InsO family protein
MRSDWAVSIRRACAAILLDPKTYRYTSHRPDQAALEQRIRDICQTPVRFGYRRVHVLLTREGWTINMKKTYRVYHELGMQLGNKTPKRRVKAKLRDDRSEAVGPGVWAMDFVYDQLVTGHKLRVLTVVDTYSRYVAVLDQIQLSGRTFGGDAGTGPRPHRLPEDVLGRLGLQVNLPQHGPMGASAGHDTGPLRSRQAHR